MDDIFSPFFIIDGEQNTTVSSLTASSVAFAIIESKKDIPIFYPEIEEEKN